MEMSYADGTEGFDMVLMTHGYVPTEASLRRMVAADRAMSERP
jgi:hypothetical protein